MVAPNFQLDDVTDNCSLGSSKTDANNLKLYLLRPKEHDGIIKHRIVQRNRISVRRSLEIPYVIETVGK